MGVGEAFWFDAIPLGISAKEVLKMDPATFAPWSAAWLWSLPVFVVTVSIHSFCLRMIDRRVSFVLDGSGENRLLRAASWVIMPGLVLCASILHGCEGAIWAAVYLLLGALPDRKSAMLYSMNAMTSYGHVNLYLESHWQLMGALESLNGWILFGLTTAFLFTVMQKAWPRLHSST
jgi:hypothetical protein